MNTMESTGRAVCAWASEIGSDAVISERSEISIYGQSVCATSRDVVAILKPRQHEQVVRLVAIANEYGIPLYPISCGKQWGMGSKLPVRDGAAIVDLSGMNRIIEVNARYHYAVVEPGVTQRQLLDYISEHDLPLMLNVTGSTSDTSLIGNAMDRGVGYFDSRAHGISNLQVVLGNGKTIQTGFGHFGNAQTENLYHHGIGPALDGLFPQGNFGIVTSACIDLMPLPEKHMSAIIKIDSEDKLPQLIDVLAGLRSRKIFTTIVHVGNRERSYITLAPLINQELKRAGEPAGDATRAKAVSILQQAGFGPWSCAIGILGSKEQLKLARREISKAVKGFAKTMYLTERLMHSARRIGEFFSFIPAVRVQLLMLKAITPVYGFTHGETTDESLKSVYWAAGDFENLDEPDPDQSNSGIMFCLPIIPAHGETVFKVVKDTRDTFRRYGFEAAITVNLMDTKAMEGVISLSFDRRDPERVKAAHDCIKEMEAYYVENGYPPYRVGINSMHQVVNEDDPFWQTVRDLKKVLDPNHIIAPGRYNLV